MMFKISGPLPTESPFKTDRRTVSTPTTRAAGLDWMAGRLGVGRDELMTFQALNKAYRKLARKFHPDTGGSSEDFQKLQAIYAMFEKDAICFK